MCLDVINIKKNFNYKIKWKKILKLLIYLKAEFCVIGFKIAIKILLEKSEFILTYLK